MAVVKYTWIFQMSGRGWTESLFRNVSSPSLVAEWDVGFLVGQKRLGWMGRQVQFKALRVSVEWDNAGNPVKGDSLLRYTHLNDPNNHDAAAPNLAAQVIFRNTDSSLRKFMFARGIWDNLSQDGGLIKTGIPDFTSNFSNWRDHVLFYGFGWIHNQRNPVDLAVLDYEQNPNQTVELTVAGSLAPWAVDSVHSVTFSGINGKSVLNGRQIVRVVNDNTVRTVRQIAVGPFQTVGKMIRYDRVFVPSSIINAQKIVTRKAGAPLLESPGRRAARVRI